MDRVYRSYLVTVGVYETRVDLLLLNMVDFDVILGMDWLYLYHAILDFHTKTVTLVMTGFPRLEWRGSLGDISNRVISFLKAQRMVEKGILVYLAFVRDASADTPTVDSVPMVKYEHQRPSWLLRKIKIMEWKWEHITMDFVLEPGEATLLGTDLVCDALEKVKLIQERLRTAQSRQKIYVDQKGMIRFGKRGKLSPLYIGPFEVLERDGKVAYRLALPPSPLEVHPVQWKGQPVNEATWEAEHDMQSRYPHLIGTSGTIHVLGSYMLDDLVALLLIMACILVMQDALIHMVGLFKGLAQAGAFPTVPAASQAGGKAQTPTNRTMYPFIGFSVNYRCHEILHNLGLVEANGVDFTTFQMQGPTKRWWQVYELGWPAGSPPLLSSLGSFGVCAIHREGEAEEAVLVPSAGSDEERVRRFIEGLNYIIRLAMSREIETGTSFYQVVGIVCRVESIQSIVSGCHKDASVLFDPGSTYSYVPLYFTSFLDMPRGDALVHVSTPIVDSIMVDRVYLLCVITICGFETRVGFLLLDMVDFDVILGMDWLSLYYVILDCHAKTVTLAMPGFPRLEWKGSLSCIPSRMISFLKAQRMVEKGCSVYLDFVCDVSSNTLIVESVRVVREFPYVFHKDLNLRQRRRLKLLKDYDITMLYHPGKAIVVADALSRKPEYGEFSIYSNWGKAFGYGFSGFGQHICELAKIYIREIVRLHGVPVSIMSNCVQADHSDFGGYVEDYVIDFVGQWNQVLPLVDFAYNNSYQFSIHMAPYEALYRRQCCSPVGRFEPGEARILSTYLVRDALEKVKLIHEWLRSTQSTQNSYVDRKVRNVAFMEGEKVFLGVSPMKGVMNIGPFEVLERVGEVAYRLDFPPSLSGVHSDISCFHVSEVL
ncbi:uncharacterized protein [Nicotiana tomentosiformis]|uniref:uncharacterized protein n=1 Tax=Nicotiana tomentosiformis TaxID=4098 RepID=UPI00388C6512